MSEKKQKELREKLSESMTKGIAIERKRCIGILLETQRRVHEGLRRKLMTNTDKQVAQVKLAICDAVVTELQMKFNTNYQPNAEAEKSEVHRPDSVPLGETQGDPDGGGAA